MKTCFFFYRHMKRDYPLRPWFYSSIAHNGPITTMSLLSSLSANRPHPYINLLVWSPASSPLISWFTLSSCVVLHSVWALDLPTFVRYVKIILRFYHGYIYPHHWPSINSSFSVLYAAVQSPFSFMCPYYTCLRMRHSYTLKAHILIWYYQSPSHLIKSDKRSNNILYILCVVLVVTFWFLNNYVFG